MSDQYSCKNLNRRTAVADARDSHGNPFLNGIDYLEVASSDQKTLALYFLFPLPGSSGAVPASPAPALTADNISISGGVRITGITVKSISVSTNVVTVQVNAAGDFSSYTLSVVTSAALSNTAPAAGFDPQLSSVDFSFKVACPTNFDCAQTKTCPPPLLRSAPIDYLAKDYSSFRQLLLDRMALTIPAWKETHPPDIGVSMVELLAYAGDQLSYFQDAVATEAYLGTARLRISVRRHARLLDYLMHDGCNARVWVCLSASPGNPELIAAGTEFTTQTVPAAVLLPQANLTAAVDAGAQVFQALYGLAVHPELNELDFYTWSDGQCCLPKGATTASLIDNGAGALLSVGDVLLFEEVVSPLTGAAADADPSHRHVVRLTSIQLGTDPLNSTKIIQISWAQADSLTFAMTVSAVISSGTGEVSVPNVSVSRGNIVLADAGFTQPSETLPPLPSGSLPYRPTLSRQGISFGISYDDAAARTQPAAGLLLQDPRQTLPLINLDGGGSTWTPVRDLLGSGRNAFQFVVETENNGSAMLRFGDGTLGASPVGGLTANFRTGNGSAGNVGAESIVHVVTTPAVPLTGISGVRNPLAAQGGIDPETLDEVRQFAPWAFRTQERAVTVADYAAVAQLQPEVTKAQATLRWTGSWYTMFVTVDRANGMPVDPAFRGTVREFLEQYRLAGYDLEVEAPVYVPLDIAFTVCIASGYFRSDVQQNLLQTFSNSTLPDGSPAFFNPTNFTFGQPVYLSRIIAAAMATPGVLWVDTDDTPPSPNRFQRWGKGSQGETAAGLIAMAPTEIARLDNDPSQPENGMIQFFTEGGM